MGNSSETQGRYWKLFMNFFTFLAEFYSVELQLDHCVLLTHEIYRKIEDFNFKSSLPLPGKHVSACSAQVFLQSHNPVSTDWPFIHSCGPLYTSVLLTNSAGKKCCGPSQRCRWWRWLSTALLHQAPRTPYGAWCRGYPLHDFQLFLMC